MEIIGRKERSKQFAARCKFTAEKMLEQLYTDEQIIDLTNKEFPNYVGSPKNFNQKECGRVRSMIRNRQIKGIKKSHESQFQRIYIMDGIYIKREDKPKAKPKLIKENDLLFIIAGIDVLSKKAKTA